MAEDKVTFAAIVIVAIVAIVGILGLTGFGAFPQVTGFSHFGTGTATVNITEMLSILLLDTNISFGSGTVTQGAIWGEIYSNNTAALNGSWSNVNDYFLLENDGNALAQVDVLINDIDFIGGTAATSKAYFMYKNNETSACLVTAGGNGYLAWYEFAASNTNYSSCKSLNYSDGSDALNYYLALRIPSDAPVGLKTATVTFTAVAVA